MLQFHFFSIEDKCCIIFTGALHYQRISFQNCWTERDVFHAPKLQSDWKNLILTCGAARKRVTGFLNNQEAGWQVKAHYPVYLLAGKQGVGGGARGFGIGMEASPILLHNNVGQKEVFLRSLLKRDWKKSHPPW